VEGVGTPSLAIIGAGRAGSALAIAAHDAGYRVAAVASRRARWQPGSRTRSEPRPWPRPWRPRPSPISPCWRSRTEPSQPSRHRSPRPESRCTAGRRPPRARFGPELIASCASPAPRLACSTRCRRWLDRTARHSWRAPTSVWMRADSCVSACWTGRGAWRHAARNRPGQRALYHAAAVLAGNAPLALLRRGNAAARGDRGERRDGPCRARGIARGRGTQRAPGRSGGGAHRAGRTRDTGAIAAHLEALEAYPEARDLYLHLTARWSPWSRPGPTRPAGLRRRQRPVA